MRMLWARQECCAVEVLRWTVVLRFARGTYNLSSGPKRASGTEQKSIRDPKIYCMNAI